MGSLKKYISHVQYLIHRRGSVMTAESNGKSKTFSLSAPEHIGDYAATQPCSGVKVIASRTHGGAVTSSAPEVVCAVKKSVA